MNPDANKNGILFFFYGIFFANILNNFLDEDSTIDNQPMATGYYISTAPALDLPDWFWSACPSARRRAPVHLKNSLHIHTGNIQQSDETATLINNKSGGGAAIDAHHPLDSTATDEVLK